MKSKYEDFRCIEICGVLDKDDDDNVVVIVDEDTYQLDDIVKDLLGHTVQIKCSY